MKKRAVGIILARGGSKRLPMKNIYPLFGRPLVELGITACKKSKYIEKVYVSTDDKEIAMVARRAGAEIIDRPAYLAEDNVWAQEALKHVVKEIEEKGERFDIVARIQANSPQVQANKIDEAIDKLIEHELWEVFSVDSEGIEDAAIHVMKRDCVFQEALSVYKGVINTDYINVHDFEDIKELEKNRIDEIEKESLELFTELKDGYYMESWRGKLLQELGRPEYLLWKWQEVVSLNMRWRAMVDSSEELKDLLYSGSSHNKVENMTVLDLGCGFGMYWPIMREFGFKKFVGVDLFDMRRSENYFRAANDYVAKLCSDCSTQLIMDDARNLAKHDLLFDKFDVVVNVATISTEINSTAIPIEIVQDIISKYGSKDCILVNALQVKR